MENKDNLVLAEACGIHIGDGYARSDEQNRRELDISGSMKEKEYYDAHVSKIFGEILDAEINCREFQNRGTYGFCVYGKEPVQLFIKELGFPNGKKENIEIPDFIKKGSKEVKFSFLRGLYDTDGYLGFYRRHGNYSEWKKTYHYYPRITLTNTDKKLIKQVKNILDNLEIEFYSRETQNNKDKQKNKAYVTTAGESRLIDFMDKIGFKNSVKLTRYKVWKKYGFCPTKTSLKERYKMLSGDLDPKAYYD